MLVVLQLDVLGKESQRGTPINVDTIDVAPPSNPGSGAVQGSNAGPPGGAGPNQNGSMGPGSNSYGPPGQGAPSFFMDNQMQILMRTLSYEKTHDVDISLCMYADGMDGPRMHVRAVMRCKIICNWAA